MVALAPASLAHLSQVNHASSEWELLAAQPGQLAPSSLCRLAGQQLEGKASVMAALCALVMEALDPRTKEYKLSASKNGSGTLQASGPSNTGEACVRGSALSGPRRSTRACATPRGGRAEPPQPGSR